MMDAEQKYVLKSQKLKVLKRARLENLAVLSILAAIAIFTAGDIISDLADGAPNSHLLGEVVVAILSFLGAVFLWRRTMNLQTEVHEQRLIAQQAERGQEIALLEAKKWKDEASNALRGLSDAIDSQMSRWKLTNAEKEVALLLLKGLSLKEIASLREVSEKTARAQSFSVYAKSGLSGRAELSAYFLEDLMLPSLKINSEATTN